PSYSGTRAKYEKVIVLAVRYVQILSVGNVRFARLLPCERSSDLSRRAKRRRDKPPHKEPQRRASITPVVLPASIYSTSRRPADCNRFPNSSGRQGWPPDRIVSRSRIASPYGPGAAANIPKATKPPGTSA